MKYSFLDILIWTGTGYIIGNCSSQIVISLLNNNLNFDKISKVAFTYVTLGLVSGFVRNYTGKTIVITFFY